MLLSRSFEYLFRAKAIIILQKSRNWLEYTLIADLATASHKIGEMTFSVNVVNVICESVLDKTSKIRSRLERVLFSVYYFEPFKCKEIENIFYLRYFLELFLIIDIVSFPIMFH